MSTHVLRPGRPPALLLILLLGGLPFVAAPEPMAAQAAAQPATAGTTAARTIST